MSVLKWHFICIRQLLSRDSHTLSQNSQCLYFQTFGYKTLQEVATFDFDKYGKFAQFFQLLAETSHIG